MRLKAEQIEAHLRRGLAPVYLVGGDEPLLVQEACDAIRARAREEGYSERDVLHVEAGFDWNALTAVSNTLSLFAERRLIELRLPKAKPGDAGGKALVAYAQRPPEDTVLVVIAGKLDAQAQRTKWVSALEGAGAFVQIWPVNPRQLPAWIQQRMRARGMQPEREAVTVLAERVEGNLLAAAQEIDKLELLYGQGPIDTQQVARAVADSSRFDVYGLVDAALAGDGARAARIVAGLRGEGIEPILVLWALAREIRGLAGMAYSLGGGQTLDQVVAAHRVWKSRQPLVKQGLKRLPAVGWCRLLAHAGTIDRMIKGALPGNAWDELLQLSLALAGKPFVKATTRGY